MDFVDAEKILRGFSIPLQPFVVSKILRLIPDLNKISEVIQLDPCLTASVIKLVNHSKSAADKVHQVDAAVHQLGIAGVTAMLNAQLLRKASIARFAEDKLVEFWKINNDVAFGCGLMARQLNLNVVDDAYYLGLFHNIGMPLMWQKYPDYFEKTKVNAETLTMDLSICELENKFFNCSHSSVGYYIARGMSLNINICEAIRRHHDMVRVFESPDVDDEVLTILSILKAVEYTCGEASAIHGRESNQEWLLIEARALEQLGVSELDFQDLKDIVEEETMMRKGI